MTPDRRGGSSADSRKPGFFAGSSPVLRGLAWLSVACLVAAWTLLALPYFGVSQPVSGLWFSTSLLLAFVSGISSFCPLGGISAGSVVLTVMVLLGLVGGSG